MSEQAHVPEDDSVIGRALKKSLLGIALLALIVAAVWLLRPVPPPPPVVEQAPKLAPQAISEAVKDAPPESRFTDISAESGVDFVHVNGAYGERLLPETMGGGVAVLDYDQDGLQDLLFVNSGTWPWREQPPPPVAVGLYRNLGNGKFSNQTDGSGLQTPGLYGMGVAVADINGDGHPDLFLSGLGKNRLFINQQDGRFEDISESAGVSGADDAWSTSASFFDYDKDGDLDLFVANYVVWSRDIDLQVDYRLTGIGRAYGPPTNYAGTQSYLYRNDGELKFSDVSEQAGIHVFNDATGKPAGKALGVHPSDLDGDGWTDILVSNDTVRNFVFLNRGDGSFEESGLLTGLAFDNSGKATGAMGVDAAAYNNDKDLAVAVGNFSNEMSSFYVARDGDPFFTDEAIISGIGADSRLALSFGLFFFDYDLDGRLDLLQTNGHVEIDINRVQPSQNYRQPTQLFWNCGPDCGRNFVLVPAEQSGDLSRPVIGRAAAYADLDQDGDLDVIITQIGEPPLLLRNDQNNDHHWLRVKLQGKGMNREALGAQLRLTANGVTQIRELTRSRGYLSQVEQPLSFGLGKTKRVDTLEITWPDGTRQVLTDIPVDQELEIRQSD